MMADDSYETVAITYSQPETAVMLSMFAFYGIPAYPVGFEHARAMSTLMVALGGIQIPVHSSAVDETRELLAEAAERPQAVRPKVIDEPVVNGFIVTCSAFSAALPYRRPEPDRPSFSATADRLS